MGTAVAEKWLAAGHKVWGVSRNAQTLARIDHPEFRPVIAEVDSSAWHKEVPHSPEIVLNCVSSAGGGVEGYRKSYLGGNQSLVDWAGKARPGRILYTSSTAVYPFTDGREVWEKDAGGPDLSETGSVVFESEKVLLSDSFCGPSTTVLRLAGIYGPGRHYLLDQVRAGDRVIAGRGDYYLNLIFREDIVAAIDSVLAVPATKGRAYNVSDGSPTPKAEVVNWIADRLGMPRPVFDPNAKSRRKMRINRAGASPNRQIRIDEIQADARWKPSYPSFRDGFVRLGI